ncbi:DUF5133 domain-containing protein [Streptomyces sp. NPDC005805]|uniref:DUF5133 domain-containing protein n=1 Tax=Streptomyces sp. NPDC005805 TaxID=3157068 RepID=UPI0033F00EA1
MLMPDTSVVARLIARYRAQENRLVDAPHDQRARRRFEDTAYTLCVLMCERTAREAVLAAESYVRRSVRSAGRPLTNAPLAGAQPLAERAASGGC